MEISMESYAIQNGGISLQAGELLVSGSYDYGLMAPYLVSGNRRMTTAEERLWEAFKQENQEYCVGQIYPSGYYYLFGGWIRGGTMSTFLMPCNMVYYRSE